ncbi:MAG: cytochrome C oxidase subunit IV family protein [Ignavibacteriales bacterium]|nr:cytochrome C oxidase subunit IV family protein [Ignavibacteriales bacterium]
MHISEKHEEHTTGYGIYILVWMSLMTLTAITVAVAGINLSNFTVATALIIASIKSYLVLTIFMHLRSEEKAFRIFVGVAIFFVLISIILLFSDYSFVAR